MQRIARKPAVRIELPTPARPERGTGPSVPALLTASEVAEVLRTSRKAVWAMIQRKQLPVTRIGRRVLVSSEALVEWLRQKSEPSLER